MSLYTHFVHYLIVELAMITEPSSVLSTTVFVKSFAHRVPKGYFRSKLFTVLAHTNPLVAAAGPLFSLLERLTVSMVLPDIHHLRQNIEHELLAFCSRLESSIVADEITKLGYFLLCTTIDELVGKHYLKIHGVSIEFQAFTACSFEEIKPYERFFDIIEHIKHQPNRYLDLIELAYHCLIIGFEGVHHHQVDGRIKLDNLIEQLFDIITEHRVSKKHLLLKASPPPTSASVISPKKYGLVSILLMGTILAALGLSHWLINQQVQTIEHHYALATQLDT